MRVIYDMDNFDSSKKLPKTKPQDDPYKDSGGKPPQYVIDALTTLGKHAQSKKLQFLQFLNGPYMIIITANQDVIDINMGIAQDLANGVCLSCGIKHEDEDFDENGNYIGSDPNSKHKLEV